MADHNSDIEITQSTHKAGGQTVNVLSLKGQLDAHTFLSLQNELEKLADENKPKVVLECKDLQYISSAGLGVLNKMSRDFRSRDGDLRLASLSEKINNVVNLLGFSKVMKVFEQLNDAVDSFRDE